MREVKIAEYWQRQEKRTRPISSHLERTRLVNKGFIRQRTLFSRGTQQGRFPFDQKFRNFRNGDKWYDNFHGKILENPEIFQFPKSEPFKRKFWNSGMKIKWNGNFQDKMLENLSMPHEVVLFFGNYANSQFSIQR